MDYRLARANMIDSQIRTNRVTDPRLLEALKAVPRERFLPEALRGIAYIDEDIDLGGSRSLMEPMVLARLLQAAAVMPGDMVLDIGCGCGYASAVLARLAGTVIALESDQALIATAEQALREQEIDNVALVGGELTAGYPEQAPYNMILLNGAVAEVPAAIQEQLADGGRLVTVLREDSGLREDSALGRATLLERRGGHSARRTLFDATTALLPGFERAPGFVF